MLKELKDNGLVRLEVSYSGGGDDGCIDTYSGYEINEKGEERWSQNSIPTNFQNEFDEKFSAHHRARERGCGEN